MVLDVEVPRVTFHRSQNQATNRLGELFSVMLGTGNAKTIVLAPKLDLVFGVFYPDAPQEP